MVEISLYACTPVLQKELKWTRFKSTILNPRNKETKKNIHITCHIFRKSKPTQACAFGTDQSMNMYMILHQCPACKYD